MTEKHIWSVCEACRVYLIDEDIRRMMDNARPLTPLQRTIIYQKYRDLVVLKEPSSTWEEVSDLFDRVFQKVEEYHKNDSLAYS